MIFMNWLQKELDCSVSTLKRGKEEMESGGSGGSEQIEGGLSGNEQDTAQQPPSKKKRYHRHTAHQIQEMEAYELNFN